MNLPLPRPKNKHTPTCHHCFWPQQGLLVLHQTLIILVQLLNLLQGLLSWRVVVEISLIIFLLDGQVILFSNQTFEKEERISYYRCTFSCSLQAGWDQCLYHVHFHPHLLTVIIMFFFFFIFKPLTLKKAVFKK